MDRDSDRQIAMLSESLAKATNMSFGLKPRHV